MRVLKFGGTSIGSEQNIRRIRTIAESLLHEDKIVIVVSAFSGVTNALEQIGKEAVMSSLGYLDILNDLRQRHVDMVNVLIEKGSTRQKLIGRIEKSITDLESISRGVSLIEELTDKTRARLMSAGELLSSTILTEFLGQSGLDAKWIDSRAIIETDDNYLDAKVDLESTYAAVAKLKDENAQFLILPGFIARTTVGATSTLGRGGSDFTAALITAGLNASVLEIWTDVDGVMSADPRIVPNATPIKEMSYEEAMELSFFGAKVIHPPTIQPVLEKSIPIRIKNTFNPDDHGTLICANPNSGDAPVRGFSSISGISLITILGSGMIGVPGTAMRLFRALSKYDLNVLFITQSSSEHTITVGVMDHDADRAMRAIKNEFEFEIHIGRLSPITLEQELTLVAAVGEQMRERVGIAGKIFSLMGENGVNIRAIAQGSTERNISFVIRSTDLVKALNVLHEGFFIFDEKVVNLFCVGIGNVGATMLRQIASQTEHIKHQFGVELRIAGIANSKSMYFNADGCAITEDIKEYLLEHGTGFQLEKFVQKIVDLNLRNSIFVDNTASEKISEKYHMMLDKSIHVVTSNKIAASSGYPNFRSLKDHALMRNVKYLYETNVAAGLPVIKTIRDLMLTGDTIHKIQAVLSGSLNFIFNTMSSDVSFSKAVSMAREEGLTEPDPGIDLSGLDVRRKILILAREAGHPMELEDVKNDDFISPAVLKADNWDSLYANLKTIDGVIEVRRKQVAARGHRMRFMAEFNSGGASVGVHEIGKDHPAYELQGKDNIVLVFSDRYQENPLVVRGAGAGPEVTASGVLSDIMHIANV